VNPRTKLRRLALALALALALLVPALAAPVANAGTAAVSLAASTSLIVFGDATTLSGTATGEAGCTGGRMVQLQWHPAGDPNFSSVADGATADDGTFSFEGSQPSTGRYRAVLPATEVCPKLRSADVVVRVQAVVDAALATDEGEVGSCVDVAVIVSPPKPGQAVELQRRSGATWTTIETLALDEESGATAAPCLGWDDAGIARFRARWNAQDPLNVTAVSAVLAIEVTKARWMLRIDDAVQGRSVSVSVGEDGEYLYRRADETPRAPASNEKLLLAMVCLDTFGPDHAIATHAAAASFADGVVDGDLWLLGRGDPQLGATSLGALADELAAAGLVRVRGRVMGSTGFFARDWDAPGWNDAARDYVNRPTALTFEGNGAAHPEIGAARSLSRQLEALGVRVAGRPGAGVPPGGLQDLATIESRPMRVLLQKILRPSWNFGAEVLGKALGVEVSGVPGTIAKGAAAIEAWVRAAGPEFTLFDNSGLSYDDRVTAAGLVRLLDLAEDASWGGALRAALPTGGQGTLEDRLAGVQVRAKTGTLTDISALSGWVYSQRRDAWIEFSILSSGMSKTVASGVEDRVVRILENAA
jgi:D-alanyl-D-alanine carboxypeptidase/D-alanyl-D-alanine-endopeptidase (penicillin-binding protein 4)